MSFHRHEFQLDRLSPRRPSCRYDTHLRTAASKGGHLRRGVETPPVAPSFNCKVTRGGVSEGMARERGENVVVFQSENRIYVLFLEVCPRRVGFSCCHPYSTVRTSVQNFVSLFLADSSRKNMFRSAGTYQIRLLEWCILLLFYILGRVYRNKLKYWSADLIFNFINKPVASGLLAAAHRCRRGLVRFVVATALPL